MQLDLNLLTALDMLLEEGSVSEAAFRLNLSAPAMSRTLGRIRRATGDQILVRTGRTMTPTPHALSIRAEVHALVQQVQAVLAPEQTLDLKTLRRTFTLQCHDAITTAIGPALLAALLASAPGLALRFLAEAPTDTNDLRYGQVDLELSSSAPALPEISFETAGHSQLVAAVRPGHLLTKEPLTLSRYAQALHLTVSRRGRLHDPIDDALAAYGMQRRVVASAPTSTAALQFVQQSDLIVAVSEQMCKTTISALGLLTLPIPLAVPSVAIHLAWHQRYDSDQAHLWLRSQVREALQVMF
jgi:DNA-binding transcriptional LysR family regulator